jgi:hypothetical protein
LDFEGQWYLFFSMLIFSQEKENEMAWMTSIASHEKWNQ